MEQPQPGLHLAPLATIRLTMIIPITSNVLSARSESKDQLSLLIACEGELIARANISRATAGKPSVPIRTYLRPGAIADPAFESRFPPPAGPLQRFGSDRAALASRYLIHSGLVNTPFLR